MKKSQVGKAGYHAENWLTKKKRKILPTALVNVMVRKLTLNSLGCFARCQNWLITNRYLKKHKKNDFQGGAYWIRWNESPGCSKLYPFHQMFVVSTLSKMLFKGNLFGRVETITPYIEGFHSSIDAKLIKSDITDVLVFVWRQTCTHLDRSSLVVVSVMINLN